MTKLLVPVLVDWESIKCYMEMHDIVEVIRCNQCRYYEGVHDVPGCAPCAFWGIGAVMWDDFCKRGEQYDSD